MDRRARAGLSDRGILRGVAPGDTLKASSRPASDRRRASGRPHRVRKGRPGGPGVAPQDRRGTTSEWGRHGQRRDTFGKPLETWTTYAGILLAPFLNLRIDIAFTLSSALYSLVFAMKLYRGTMPRSPLGVVAWTWFPALVLIVCRSPRQQPDQRRYPSGA